MSENTQITGGPIPAAAAWKYVWLDATITTNKNDTHSVEKLPVYSVWKHQLTANINAKSDYKLTNG